MAATLAVPSDFAETGLTTVVEAAPALLCWFPATAPPATPPRTAATAATAVTSASRPRRKPLRARLAWPVGPGCGALASGWSP